MAPQRPERDRLRSDNRLPYGDAVKFLLLSVVVFAIVLALVAGTVVVTVKLLGG